MKAQDSLLTLVLATISVGSVAQQIEIPDWEHAVRFRLVASQRPVRPGDEMKLAVLMDIRPGYHLYGPKEDRPSRTAILLKGDLVPAGNVEFPPTVKRDLAGLGEFDLYEGSVTIQIPVRVPEVALTGSIIDAVVEVKHQVCTDQACSPPTSTVLTVPLPVAHPGDPVERRHPEVFDDKVHKSTPRREKTLAFASNPLWKKGESMPRLVHTSRIRIEKDKGPLRRAYVEGFEAPLRFGVHTNIKDFYGIEPEEELPATLDHIIAGVGG